MPANLRQTKRVQEWNMTIKQVKPLTASGWQTNHGLSLLPVLDVILEGQEVKQQLNTQTQKNIISFTKYRWQVKAW